jgi:hypothetical protein
VSLLCGVTTLQCHTSALSQLCIVTALQCHSSTLSQLYSVTALHCHSSTVSQLYSVTDLQCHSSVAPQLFCFIDQQWSHDYKILKSIQVDNFSTAVSYKCQFFAAPITDKVNNDWISLIKDALRPGVGIPRITYKLFMNFVLTSYELLMKSPQNSYKVLYELL